jgi:hypothetical protein
MSAIRDEVRGKFLADIATHQMHVLLDNGLYRHLRFRRPGTYCMGFDVVTWPGYLAICGDMGEYVFTRIEDMFAFFRSDSGCINPPYWAEKCRAADRNGKIEEFSEDRFRALVLERLLSYCDGDEELHARLLEEVRNDVFSRLSDGPAMAYDALGSVQSNGDAVFSGYWEMRCHEYTWHYLWICNAIAWAVVQYDAHLALTAAPGASQ